MEGYSLVDKVFLLLASGESEVDNMIDSTRKYVEQCRFCTAAHVGRAGNAHDLFVRNLTTDTMTGVVMTVKFT